MTNNSVNSMDSVDSIEFNLILICVDEQRTDSDRDFRSQHKFGISNNSV